MKTIHSIEVDVKGLKGAINSLESLLDLFKSSKSVSNDFQDSLKQTKSQLEGVIEGLESLDDSPVNKITNTFTKLRGAISRAFQNLTMFKNSIRDLAFNGMSKLISAFKVGLGLIGGLVGSVTALFNVANGTNATVSEGAMAGLSYAEQRGLENANKETGFNANLAGHRNAFNQGLDTAVAKTFMTQTGMTEKEFEDLRNDSRSYYKMNDVLFKKFKDIEKASPNRDMAIEQFKAQFSEVLNNFGYGDVGSFIQANESGVVGRHRERFEATTARYSGVDVNALMKGERALDDFSETLKGFALGVASKFLPSLTKNLKALTGVFEKFSKNKNTAETVSLLGDLLGSFFDMIMVVGEKLMGYVSKLFGGDFKGFAKDNLQGASATFKAATAYVKGDKETYEKQKDLAKEKLKSVTNKITSAAGSLATDALTTVGIIDKDKAKGKGDYNFDENYVRDAKGNITYNPEKSNSLRGSHMEGQEGEQFKNVTNSNTTNTLNSTSNVTNNKGGNISLTIPINIEGRQISQQEVKIDPLKGIISSGRASQGSRL